MTSSQFSLPPLLHLPLKAWGKRKIPKEAVRSHPSISEAKVFCYGSGPQWSRPIAVPHTSISACPNLPSKPVHESEASLWKQVNHP